MTSTTARRHRRELRRDEATPDQAKLARLTKDVEVAVRLMRRRRSRLERALREVY